MTRRLVSILAAGLVMAVAMGTGAQQNGQGQKKSFTGPIQQTFGALNLALEQGASVETDYYPDQTRLLIRTTANEAVVTTSARNLVLVENQEGNVEVTLPTGRRIKIEPNRSEIVGRALADDPGTISIRIASAASITVLGDFPATALSGVVTTPSQLNPSVTSRPETSLSPFRGFGTSFSTP